MNLKTLRLPILLLVAAALGHLARAADASGSIFTAKELAQGYRDGTVLAKPRRDHLGSFERDGEV